jgi:hypothetical protein
MLKVPEVVTGFVPLVPKIEDAGTPRVTLVTVPLPPPPEHAARIMTLLAVANPAHSAIVPAPKPVMVGVPDNVKLPL